MSLRKIVLLAHSHVGMGAYEALVLAGLRPVLAYGYSQMETAVPCPDLLQTWENHGINTRALHPGASMDFSGIEEGDLLISANWRHYIPIKICRRFRLAVNLHGANTVLAEYRGRAPVQRQVADRNQTYFLSCHRLAPEIDSGEILAQACWRYPHVPTVERVYHDLCPQARKLICWILDNHAALAR